MRAGTLLYDPIKAHSLLTDKVVVSFSGGKESIVTLDLCMKYFKEVKAFYMYKVPDLEFQEQTLRKYERHYGIDIIRIPHPDLSAYMSLGIYRFPDRTIPIIEFNDIYDYVRQETGIYWITAGERINDSITRRAMIKHSGTTDFKRGRFYTVANWTKQDILQYIKKNRLYYPQDSEGLGRSSFTLAPRDLSFIRQTFPEDYERILRIFPLADVARKRYEIQQELDKLDALQESNLIIPNE